MKEEKKKKEVVRKKKRSCIMCGKLFDNVEAEMEHMAIHYK